MLPLNPVLSNPKRYHELTNSSQADAENRYCYLESSNGINPKIYRKLGFEIVKKIHLTRAAKPVELDVMVRKPVKSPI